MSHDPEEDFAEMTYELDDSPSWWAVLLLPPLVVILVVTLTALNIWDCLCRLCRR